MDEQYDAIVLGTGLKECILSGLLSHDGKKVLHMDRNNYYGGESASLNLNQLFEKFANGQKPDESLGPSRDYNVDLIPKFIISGGMLVKMLVHTNVRRYMQYRVVDGSFVFVKGKIEKVPATDREALASNLMGFFEKRRCKNFLEYVANYKQEDPSTHKGMDASKITTSALFKKFSLEDGTIEFIGHASALHRDDSYLNQPALDTVNRIKLYADSMARYGHSPYIYPLYGLGELPQGFARMAAIHGGTYMLSKPIEQVLYNDDGTFLGVKSEGEVAKAKVVIGDPSYFPDKVKRVGAVVRSICILSHPVPHTGDCGSCQIIIPQAQVNRKSDIYVSVLESSHNVAPKGKFIAICSTTVETAEPDKELYPALGLLGPIDCRFTCVYNSYDPTNDSKQDNVFISKSFDATSHFETTCDDVCELYQKITGKVLDLTNFKVEEDDEE